MFVIVRSLGRGLSKRKLGKKLYVPIKDGDAKLAGSARIICICIGFRVDMGWDKRELIDSSRSLHATPTGRNNTSGR